MTLTRPADHLIVTPEGYNSMLYEAKPNWHFGESISEVSIHFPFPIFTFKTVLGLFESVLTSLTKYATCIQTQHAVAIVSGHGTAGIVLLLYAQCAGVQLPAAIRQ
jgi:hypothetical protein